MTTLTRLLPLGTRVAVLEDTFGDLAVTGTIAGYVAYTRPHDTVTDQGYALHLDNGFYPDLPAIPVGMRPWIGTIVVHVESVTAHED
jgi:hypothetical protein